MSSEPQIARRCPSCGASIRMRGDFCPQCGKQVPAQRLTSESVGAGETAEVTSPADTLPLDLSGAATSELTNDYVAPNQAETIPLEPPIRRDLTTAAEVPTAALPYTERFRQASASAGSAGAVGRARAAGEALSGNVMQSVGKLREISTVVADEAAYDPSLRFLLVAAILFVLFLIILILSEVIN